MKEFVGCRVRDIPRVGSRHTDTELGRMVREGADVIQLKPYPYVALPPHIIEAAEKAVRASTIPPSAGLPEFREAVAMRVGSELSISINPESQVLATAGGMHALYVTFSALLSEGDEVIVPSPCYFLEGIIEPVGGRIVYVPMREEEDYRWDLESIASSIGSRTKLIFLNTPVNPTGYVLTAADLIHLAAIADEHDLLVIADESYDRMVYDGARHLSPLTVPGMAERTILIRSFTKSYAMPNWRIGYIVASPELMGHFTKVLEWMMLYGNYVSQKAATAALTGPRDWLRDVVSDFQANRDLVCDGLRTIDGLRCVKPRGGPFIFPNISRLNGTCEGIASVLLEQFGVPSVAGPCFHSEKHIRLAFGGAPAMIEELLRRLKLAIEQIGLT